MVPDDDHAIVLPWASVIVIIVLLNDAFTWATPEAMFLRSRRRTRVASLPIIDPFAARASKPHLHVAPLRITSSCQRSASPALCGCAHWYGCAGREPAGRVDAATHDSSPDPSTA